MPTSTEEKTKKTWIVNRISIKKKKDLAKVLL